MSRPHVDLYRCSGILPERLASSSPQMTRSAHSSVQGESSVAKIIRTLGPTTLCSHRSKVGPCERLFDRVATIFQFSTSDAERKLFRAQCRLSALPCSCDLILIVAGRSQHEGVFGRLFALVGDKRSNHNHHPLSSRLTMPNPYRTLTSDNKKGDTSMAVVTFEKLIHLADKASIPLVGPAFSTIAEIIAMYHVSSPPIQLRLRLKLWN